MDKLESVGGGVSVRPPPSRPHTRAAYRRMAPSHVPTPRPQVVWNPEVSKISMNKLKSVGGELSVRAPPLPSPHGPPVAT